MLSAVIMLKQITEAGSSDTKSWPPNIFIGLGENGLVYQWQLFIQRFSAEKK